VLFVNGLMLLDIVPARSAAVLNLFVGAMQCVLPTIMLVLAHGDDAAILAASGLYLFGFTYLYVGIVNLAGLEPEGIGWFSLFVAGGAVVYAVLSFTVVRDPVFGVIWLSWSVLWLLFFLVLGLHRDQLTRFTGWAVVLLSQPTCTLPAFLMLSGNYRTSPGIAAVWALGFVTLFVAAKALSSRHSDRSHTTATQSVHS
jgi:hypothetical protein